MLRYITSATCITIERHMMHRADLLTLLNRYQPSTAEVKAKECILTFIHKHENCFDRSLLAGHITASAWLLNKEDSAALLMHHVKLDKWMQLGGHCDGDPNVYAVAIKEAQEESGINAISLVKSDIFDLDVHAIPAYKDVPAHYHYDIRFLLQVTSDESYVQNHESHELRWIKKDGSNLPFIEPSVRRMFDKWRLNTITDYTYAPSCCQH